MKRRLSSIFSGNSVGKRAMRGSALTIMGFAGERVLRLASNLILTRLLFPEAFGLMALVQVFMGGLTMFSDIGLQTSIVQNKRGDEPDFLNTAWTLQIIRGFILWGCACALAWPAAALYEEPMLAQLLPVAGLTAVIAGFQTTKIATASRHLALGRQTLVELGSQAVGIVIMVVLAYLLESVWALVFGGIASWLVKAVALHIVLPGPMNRLCWDKSAVSSLLHFGKFIFLATFAVFIVKHSDRAVLGNYISLAELGVYTVGMLLGTMPLLLTMALSNKIVLPLYRMKPPAESEANQRQIKRARRGLITIALLPNILLAWVGIGLVELMYDDRYLLAGPMVVLFSLATVPPLIFNIYGGVLLAHGDSKRHFVMMFVSAGAHLLCLFVGINQLGLFGAILAPGLAALITHPLRVVFLSKYKAYDAGGDVCFLLLGASVNGALCWSHWDKISALIT